MNRVFNVAIDRQRVAASVMRDCSRWQIDAREVRALMGVSFVAFNSYRVSINRRCEMTGAADSSKKLWESQVALRLKQAIMHISIVSFQCVARSLAAQARWISGPEVAESLTNNTADSATLVRVHPSRSRLRGSVT